MADQYGINLGNVLETKDRIAMNKLRKTKMEKETAVQEAGEKNMYNRLRSENPNMGEDELKSMSLNSDLYEYDRGRKDKANDRSASFSNSLALQNHSLSNSKQLVNYRESAKAASIDRETSRRLKIIKATNPDMPDDVAEAYAGEQVKDFTKVLDTLHELKSEGQVDGMMKSINKDGAMLHTIASMQDPAQQEQAWNEYRNGRLKSIENPEVFKQAMKKLPEKFDPNWTALTIASSSELMKDAKKAKDYLKQTKAEVDAGKGDGIGTPTYSQQTSKVNAISKKVDGHFEDMDEPKMAQEVKAEVVKRWTEGGRKQNEDEIILEVINEREQNELANTAKEKSVMQKIKSRIGLGDKAVKTPSKQAPNNNKNAKILGKASKPEGTVGTYQGKKIEVVNGEWVAQE